MNSSEESDDHRLEGRHFRRARASTPSPAAPTPPLPTRGDQVSGDDEDDGDESDEQLDAVTRLMGFLRDSD